MGRRFPLFLDHAPEDAGLARRLVHHLTPLVRRQVVEIWHPGELKGGDVIEEDVRAALDRAQVAVFLYSADASTSPVHERMRLAYERHQEGSLQLLPLLARSYTLDPEEFRGLRPLLAGKPATDYDSADDACQHAAAEIQRVLDVLLRHPYGARPTLGVVAADAFRLDRKPQWEQVKRRCAVGEHTLFLLYGQRGQAVTYFARRVGELLQASGGAPFKPVQVSMMKVTNAAEVETQLRVTLARELGDRESGDLGPLLLRQCRGQRLFLLLGEAQRWSDRARQALAAFFLQRLPALLPREGAIYFLLMFEYERPEVSLRAWVDGWASGLVAPRYCPLPEAVLPTWAEVEEVLVSKGADAETIAAMRHFYDELTSRDAPSFQALADALDVYLS